MEHVAQRTVGTKNFHVRIGTWDEDILREVIEDDCYQFRTWSAKRDPQFIVDVGAHIGGFSVLATRLCPKARVIAFEMLPENFALLLRNVDDLPKVRPFNNAVCGEGQVPSGYDEPEMPNTGNAQVRFNGANASSAPTGITLAGIFKQHKIDRIDYLKLDCEGSEWPILLTAPAELLDRIDHISMEVHLVDGYRSIDRMQRLLARQFPHVGMRKTGSSKLWILTATR